MQKVIRYNGWFLMRQFEVLKGKRVQLKERKDNCSTSFLVSLHLLFRYI